MNKNILLTLQYDGTKYSGWQRQGNTSNTIEEKITSVLKILLKQEIEIHGSGRTDAGVHAIEQKANFHANTEKQPLEIMEYLNKYLPEDINVVAAEEVDKRFHARLSAKSKEYVYRLDIAKKPNVFTRKYVWHNPTELDISKMLVAAEYFKGKHDFASFSDMRGNKSTVRTIFDISISQNENIIEINFHGDGFLYHMVRKLTAALVMVGTDELSKEQLLTIFNEMDRKAFTHLAPAKGLALKKVYY